MPCKTKKIIAAGLLDLTMKKNLSEQVYILAERFKA